MTTSNCSTSTGACTGPPAISTYAYDDFGRLSSVANPDVASARASYTYDGFDRVIAETHGETSKTTSFDPFDRVTVQTVTKGDIRRRPGSATWVPRSRSRRRNVSMPERGSRSRHTGTARTASL